MGASGVRSIADIRDIFVSQFYFGCEGDDPLNALAFDPMGTAFDAKLLALYGSDIGHWDVPDMRECAEEAYELVEHGMVKLEELREFLFVNPVKFWTATNPNFFKGTAVEHEARQIATALTRAHLQKKKRRGIDATALFSFIQNAQSSNALARRSPDAPGRCPDSPRPQARGDETSACRAPR